MRSNNALKTVLKIRKYIRRRSQLIKSVILLQSYKGEGSELLVNCFLHDKISFISRK